jgi:nucleoside-diphosphate-sugar epimerase
MFAEQQDRDSHMKFTILGGTGFIGRHMVAHLSAQGIEVDSPKRDVSDITGRKLGHVIYAIGLTGNFRRQHRSTVDANVHTLQKLMDGADFDSWLYLSSTRIYGGLGDDARATENTAISVKPGSDAIYDISKLLGESICLGMDHPRVRVARLSNVYGAGQSRNTFLGAVMVELADRGRVCFHEMCSSSKDYISIEDVVCMLQNIALGGRERLYNIASGMNVTHQQLADGIKRCGYAVDFATESARRSFPIIDTARLTDEFGPVFHSILDDLPALIGKGSFVTTALHSPRERRTR